MAKYRIALFLEMETEDDVSRKFIENDLEQEINCASYFYEVKETIIEKQD